MRYCRKCVLPDTRPNLSLSADGVCNACESHRSKMTIDWAARGQAFRQVAEHARSRGSGYDCVIPVSGGKDSTWQVVKCLELGLHPLAVTWKTPGRTAIGARNLANLVRVGVDHIDYQISPAVERRFVYESFTRYGSTAIPMHMALFNIPTAIAVRFGIPLVVWGENSAFEYGGTESERTGFSLDAEWLRRFGVTHGTTAEDWVSPTLSRKELTAYFGPSQEELDRAAVKAVFMGYYFAWNPQHTREVAVAHGFEADPSGPRTGLYDYADIDDDFISVHHWLKWYKFGFTRLYDNLSLEIRNGRISREAAIGILRQRGDETPRADIVRLCEFLGVAPLEFQRVCEGFRNPDIWYRESGVWKIRDFLIPDWPWSESPAG